MSAAVPDPRPTVCLCDGRPGPHGYGDSGCLDAVPVPRFRDQLADEQKRHWFGWVQQHQTWKARCSCKAWEEWVTNTALANDIYGRWQLHAADALLPLVDARVQAAAKQRAAEVLELAGELNREADRTVDITARIAMRDAAARAAALASPAPAPHAEATP